MTSFCSGSVADVWVLGAGRQRATVEHYGPMSFHGVPNFAHVVRVRLADGSAVDGIKLPTGPPWFENPRVRWIGLVD